MDLAAELQKIYDSEINVSISWLWDGGIEVRLGDKVNGFVAEETFALVAGIAPWLKLAIAHFYPDSTYARSLNDEVRQLAAQRLFRTPEKSIQFRCPHCGAPNAATPGMEELIAFICCYCGASVDVDQRKIQERAGVPKKSVRRVRYGTYPPCGPRRSRTAPLGLSRTGFSRLPRPAFFFLSVHWSSEHDRLSPEQIALHKRQLAPLSDKNCIAPTSCICAGAR
jgi:hypothetical protein